MSGFGIRERGYIANELRCVQLPLVDQAKCRTSIDKKRSDTGDIFTDMFCAGLPEGSKDTFQGDTGSVCALEDDGYF